MCGRYAITLPPKAMEEVFGTIDTIPNFPPHYNAAPTQPLPVIRTAKEGRRLELMRWGLVPSWSKGPDSRFSMFNARAETVAEKPAFRSAFRARRCLVPASGFFEWKGTKGGKQPVYISLKGIDAFAFAGLWEHWAGAEGDEINSFTIIVTAANDLVRPIHDRMPVIIDPEHYELWLDSEKRAPTVDLAMLMRPYPADKMQVWAVSRRVNSPANDDENLIDPVEEAADGAA
jgi:putative SOS response-associated peptidase YedK